MTAQPYVYRRRELVEPDWTRLPGWRGVTREQWESAQWQRVNCVKNVRQLRAVLGDTASTSGSTPTSPTTSSGWRPCRCCCRRR